MGRDDQTWSNGCYTDSFNPRARMGRDRTLGRRCQSPQGFNPRARMGRDRLDYPNNGFAQRVSIHAPAWGATRRLGAGVSHGQFQSTRPHGARPYHLNLLIMNS